jgi:hypothetical protein
MFKYFHIELVKLKRNRLFYLFLLAPTILSVGAAYLIADGILIKGTLPTSKEGWEIWRVSSAILFTFQIVIFFAFGGLFLIAWQQQEFKDNTFRWYEILPLNIFVVIVVRFVIYFSILCFSIILSSAMDVILIEKLFLTKYAEFASSLQLTQSTLGYFYHASKLIVFLGAPIHLLFYLATFKITRVSVQISLWIVFIVGAFLPLPTWALLGNVTRALQILRNVYSTNPLYTFDDLSALYIQALTWTVLLLVVCSYLINQKKLFTKGI